MATDPKTVRTTITYPGGSVSAPRGLLEDIFGPALVSYEMNESKTVQRDGHTRTAFIGAAARPVRAATYQKKRYGHTGGSEAAGGEPILLLSSSGWFTARLHGSHQAFCNFLKVGTWQSSNLAIWKSEKGTDYGPFNNESTTV